MAALEDGAAAVAYPSGMAAISASIEALGIQRPGRLVLPQDMYFGIRSLLTGTEFGRKLDVVSVDMTDPSAVEHACQETKLGIVWIETPSNPLVSIVDIVGVAKIGRMVRCGDRRRQHMGDTIASAPAGTRRRLGGPLAHQIHRRPQ